MTRMKGTIGFEGDIKPLFTEQERACMLDFFDLWSWRDVRDNSTRTLEMISSGKMPPGGWPSDKRELFAAWVEEGIPKVRGEKYSAFFRDLDSWTEYWDVYRPETEGKYFFGANGKPGYLNLFWTTAFPMWRDYAKFENTPDGPELLETLKTEIQKPDVSDGLLAVDELLFKLVTQHFGLPDGKLDVDAYLDCVEKYAIDVLPADQDRFDRIKEGDPRKNHALYHTMDGSVMWFNWVAHINCSSLIAPSDESHASARALLAAGAAIGAPLDYLFRGGDRGKTRPEYKADESTRQLLRSRGARWATNLDRGLKEGRELYAIYST